MQAYLKYKAYYDTKANASILKEKDHVYNLQQKVQSTREAEIPFERFSLDWLIPYIIVRVLPSTNYVVRGRIGTHRTQTLHRMRIRPFQPRPRYTTFSPRQKTGGPTQT